MQGKVIIGTEIETKSFDKQIQNLENKLDNLEKYANSKNLAPKKGTTEYIELQSEIEKTKNKLSDLYKKQVDINKTEFSNLSKGITKVTKKIGKMALAVFGIRSAFMFVRNAINTISGDDEQLKADIEYMKNALAYTLEPIVRAIVNLAKQLMFYVGYIVKLFTGKNIFENANKSLKSANTQATKLSKTLAGFDEMNILSDTSSAGGGGTVSPSFDLSNIGEADLTGLYTWLDKIKEIFNNVFNTIKENIKKVMLDLGFSEEYIKMWEFMVEGIKTLINGLLDFIKGILEIIIGLTTGNTEMVKDGIKILFASIGEILKGFVQVVAGTWGMILTSLYDLFIKPAKQAISNFISGAIEKFKNMFIKIGEYLLKVGSTVGNIIGSAFKAVINGVLSAIENILNSPIKSINELIKTINKIPGINLGTIQTFKLPRLAQGGIVNNPGNGVFMGSYVAGERGAEAVIPLSDETLDRLGLAFARHTTINATIPVYAYNRQVAREIRKIEAEQSFAYNR